MAVEIIVEEFETMDEALDGTPKARTFVAESRQYSRDNIPPGRYFGQYQALFREMEKQFDNVGKRKKIFDASGNPVSIKRSDGILLRVSEVVTGRVVAIFAGYVLGDDSLYLFWSYRRKDSEGSMAWQASSSYIEAGGDMVVALGCTSLQWDVPDDGSHDWLDDATEQLLTGVTSKTEAASPSIPNHKRITFQIDKTLRPGTRPTPAILQRRRITKP